MRLSNNACHELFQSPMTLCNRPGLIHRHESSGPVTQTQPQIGPVSLQQLTRTLMILKLSLICLWVSDTKFCRPACSSPNMRNTKVRATVPMKQIMQLFSRILSTEDATAYHDYIVVRVGRCLLMISQRISSRNTFLVGSQVFQGLPYLEIWNFRATLSNHILTESTDHSRTR